MQDIEINEVRALCLYLVDECEEILPRIGNMARAIKGTPYVADSEFIEELDEVHLVLLRIGFAAEQVIAEADALDGEDAE